MCDATPGNDRETWNTTPPRLIRSTLEPPNLMDLVVFRLKQRGVESAGVITLRDESVAYIFTCKGKVCSVFIVDEHRNKILEAFTTNSVTASDNFDAILAATIADTAESLYSARLEAKMDDKSGIPPENCVFGAGKVLTALNAVNDLLCDSNATALDVLGVMFDMAPSEYLAQWWYAAKRGSRAVSAQLAMYLMKKDLLSIYDSVVKLAADNHDKRAGEIAEKGTSKTPSLDDDPVVNTCIAHVQYLKMWSAANRNNKDVEAWAEMYWWSMLEVLEVIHLAHPKVAKMGVGRAVSFACIKKPWDTYAALMVAFARRAMLCSNPVQLYTFCVPGLHCKSDEFSTGDAIWAHRIKPFKEGMGPLDVFLPKMVLDKALDGKREEIIELMRGKAKLLGTANAMVLDSVKCEVTGEGSHGPLADPDIIAYLKKIGWEDWFNAKILNTVPFGVFDCVIDPMVADILRTTTKGDAEAFLDSLSEELA